MSDWFGERKRSFYAKRAEFVVISCLLYVLCASAIFFLMPSVAADEHSPSPLVLELRLEGVVDPILATYIDEGLVDAASRHAALVLITMDTPGGLSVSMQDIIQHILASSVPVAVYVSPTGGRGASAGFYILLSADIAAMAPGTHTGSATPVMAIGGFLPMQIDDAFRKKINADATAFLRSFTERRGRNPRWRRRPSRKAALTRKRKPWTGK